MIDGARCPQNEHPHRLFAQIQKYSHCVYFLAVSVGACTSRATQDHSTELPSLLIPFLLLDANPWLIPSIDTGEVNDYVIQLVIEHIIQTVKMYP